MRKIATLAIAASMAVAAFAPAAFANNPHCIEKDFAPSMKVQAQDKTVKGKNKIANAYIACNTPDNPSGFGWGF